MTTDTLEQMAERLIVRSETVEEVVEDNLSDTPADAVDDEPATLEADTESEPDEAAEQAEVPEAPTKFKVKVDGEEVEVSLEELTRSYSGQGKIQRGMQEAAAAKKAAAAELDNLQNVQRQVLEFAEALQSQGLKPMPKAPDVALAQTDFVKYTRDRAKYEVDAAAYNQQQAQLSHVQQLYKQQEAQAQAAYLAEQAAKLTELLPEYADPKGREVLTERLVKTAAKFGYSAEEVAGVMDARAVAILHKAALYDELQAGTAAAKAEKRPPVTVKPSAKRPEPVQLARSKVVAQAKKSGSLRDWADALLVPKSQ